MSQFLLLGSATRIAPPEGISLHSIGPGEDFLRSVARHYFPNEPSPRLVVDAHGRAESLVDDVWEAQRAGRDAGDTPLVHLLTQLVHGEHEFVCWSGNDFRDLPLTSSLRKVMDELLSQTSTQPADLFLHFRAESSERARTACASRAGSSPGRR